MSLLIVFIQRKIMRILVNSNGNLVTIIIIVPKLGCSKIFPYIPHIRLPKFPTHAKIKKKVDFLCNFLFFKLH